MGQVNVTINDKHYRMACDDGEEAHLAGLAERLNESIEALRERFGEIGDQRLTVMAAITFADQAAEAQRRIAHLEHQLSEAENARLAAREPPRDQGSIIVVLATDAPLDHRQLRRVATRAAAGIGRTGSYYGHGSGDIALAFSTAWTVPHAAPTPILEQPVLAEPLLEGLFEAAAEATEQAIVDALFSAETVTGFDGHVRHALVDIAPDWASLPG